MREPRTTLSKLPLAVQSPEGDHSLLVRCPVAVEGASTAAEVTSDYASSLQIISGTGGTKEGE